MKVTVVILYITALIAGLMHSNSSTGIIKTNSSDNFITSITLNIRSSNISNNFNVRNNSISFNNTMDLIIAAATCHPILKPCQNGEDCIAERDNGIYKCHNSDIGSTLKPLSFTPANCDPISSICGSGETCISHDGIYQCHILSENIKYLCNQCKHGECKLDKDSDVYCSCNPQWTGNLCMQPCNRDCTIGTCILKQGEPVCKCPINYKPESNCTENYYENFTKPPVSVTAYAILSAILAIVLLLILFVIFLMWKKRFRFFMKFAYYFQPFADKEEKLYDVFISYKSSPKDEFWVKNILFPKIENDMRLKACIHFRDFIPGETISNNIIESIQNSRRTLLVLTNDYIQSEWTRMEYQVAQQEMLKFRHRIIPVIFDDVKNLEIKDKNLKFIIESVTYLEWPSNSNCFQRQAIFWENLKKILPKNAKCI